MSNQSKNRRGLWLGILVAVMVLTMVLCMVGCKEQVGTGETTAPTVATDDAGAGSGYDLYWNLDRALYDGLSEAGMSSREPGEDGLFHVRFFKDGQIVELPVADRKVINSIEVQDLMGLEFDENGIVTGVISVDSMPLEKQAWQFYVQSIGGKMIKVNSSITFNGLEIMLETDENTGIWDMTGQSGEVGCPAKPMQLDRVMAMVNEEGVVTHLFLYERPNYMQTHEGECKHCKKTVTWYEWEKQGILPVNSGHYQLVTDLENVDQSSMVEDAKICLDLNGHLVDGMADTRVYSLHNPGTELVIMDTSEAKTGRIAAHGTGDQGMCVWLRYGVFHLYEGILDGSDAKTLLNGTTVNQASNTYFYMHGGELIGGVSAPRSNGKGGWSAGYGGTLFMNPNSKFVMNGGVLRDGYAKAVITKYDENGKPSSWSNGVGGNIYANDATIELNGGIISNGVAGNHSGNIFLNGKSDMTINNIIISNGRCESKHGNAGNLFVNSEAKVIMYGGTIRNGRTYNCAGNVYVNGRFQLVGGTITGGKNFDWETREEIKDSPNRNVFNVQGDFYMGGGRVAGGFQCIDTSNDNNPTILSLIGRPIIYDDTGVGPHLTLSDTSSGTKCEVSVGRLHKDSKVAISAVQSPIFTGPTDEQNVDKFISAIPESEIIWTEEGMAIGKGYTCVCGSNSDDPAAHLGDCDGTKHIWAGVSTLPTRSGYFYLTGDITVSAQRNITLDERQEVYLDLNGHKAMAVNGERLYLVQKDNVLGITDHVGGGVMGAGGQANNNCGGFLMQNTSTLKIYGGTLTVSDAVDSRVTHGGIIQSSGTVAMYGGTITGGLARVGGNISSTGKVYILGGTVSNGTAQGIENGYGLGGNISMEGAKAELIIRGENTVISGGSAATIKDGKAGWAPGGNIFADTGAKVTIEGGATVTGGSSNDGNNIYLSTNDSVMNLNDCTIHNTSDGSSNIAVEAGTVTIDGATITNTGAGVVNVLTNNTGNYVAAIYMKSGTISGGSDGNVGIYQDDFFVMTGGTVKDGVSSYGSNVYLARNARFDMQGGTITGAVATDTTGRGASVALQGTSVMNMSGGTISGGQSSGYGGNIGIYNNTTVNITGGTVTGGVAKEGGNIVVNGAGAKLNINGPAVISAGTANGGGWAPGGNIFANGGATVTISGGATVTGGTATGSNPQGHNLCMDSDNTTMNLLNCTIHNTSDKNSNIGFDAGTLNVEGANITNAGAGTVNIRTSNYAGCAAKVYIKSGTVSGAKEANIWLCQDDICVMTGGTIKDGQGGYGSNVYLEKNARFDLQGGTISGGVATSDKGRGANVALEGTSVFNMSGGTVSGGKSSGYGGNIGIYNNTTVNITGGTVTGGVGKEGGNISINGAGAKLNIDGPAVISAGTANGGWAPGGNIFANGGATVNIGGGATITGGTATGGNPQGHNLCMDGATTTINLYDCTVHNTSNGNANIGFDAGTLNIDGATVTNEGSAVVNILTSNYAGCVAKVYIKSGTISGGTDGNIGIYEDDICVMTGGTIKDGRSSFGSNVYLAKNGRFDLQGGTISGGVGTQGDGYGANIALQGTSVFNMSGGTVEGGQSSGYGGNFGIYNNTTVNITGGTVTGGVAKEGGNISINGANAKLNINGPAVISAGTANGGGWAPGGNIFAKGGATVNIGGGATVTGGVATGSNPQGHNLCMDGATTTMNLYNCTVHNTSNKNANIGFDAGTLNIDGATITNTGSAVVNVLTSNYAGCVAKVYIKSGTISGGTDGNIGLYEDDFCVMTGGTVKDGTSIYGSNVYLARNARFDLKGGTISGGAGTVAQGGSVALEGTSVFNMSGGTIENGTNTSFGGNVGIFKNTTFNMSGGTITGGTAKQGGNIYIAANGTMVMSGGVVENGVATEGNGSGNIRVEGTLNMTDGIIRYGKFNDNANETAANVRFNGTVNMSGGHIYGRIIGSGTLNLSGAPKIYQVNDNGDNLYRDNNLSAGGTINIGELTEEAVIGVMTTSAAYANGTTAFATIKEDVAVDPARFYPRTVMEVNGAWVVSDAYEMVVRDGKLYFSPIANP